MNTALPVRFHHVGISVADLDAQIAWYQNVLGLEAITERLEIPEPAIRVAMLQSANGLRVELIERSGSDRRGAFADPIDETRAQGYAHWAMEVSDLEDVFAKLTAAGAEKVWPPADSPSPGMRFAFIKDPEGNTIELLQPAAPEC